MEWSRSRSGSSSRVMLRPTAYLTLSHHFLIKFKNRIYLSRGLTMSFPNHNTHIIVKNISGTSSHKCSCCSSWLEHWWKYGNSRRTTCARRGCNNPIDVGAHVIHTDGRASNQWWIVPLCHGCNRLTEPFAIDNNCYLAPGTKDSCIVIIP